MDLAQRTRGCLLGGALGDALGYPIEFMRSAVGIELVYGKEAPDELAYANVAPAFISDDTQMTLFCAEGIVAARLQGASSQVEVIQCIAASFVNWLRTQTTRTAGPGASPIGLMQEYSLFAQRAPGRTCLSALEALSKRFPSDVGSRAAPPNDSKGCGAVMRAAPVGIVAASAAEAFSLGCDTGAITHGHPSGYLPAGVLAVMVRSLLDGLDAPTALQIALALLAGEPQAGETLDILQRAQQLATQGPATSLGIEAFAQGWMGHEALAIALYCFLSLPLRSADQVRSALWTCAKHGGDSDSTASILGNLIGAQVGEGGLPTRWLEQLQMRSLIERVADALVG